MKRAVRRHHKARKKAQAKRRARQLPGIVHDMREQNEKDAIKRADHQKNCSCVLCGNPRRHKVGAQLENERTRQEHLSHLSEQEQIREYGES